MIKNILRKPKACRLYNNERYLSLLCVKNKLNNYDWYKY
nr:MAG TPA: hypothetical protein [Bacteriophage sp.]